VPTIDQRDPTPYYIQLANLIAADIANGTFKPDERLPSTPRLMRTHGIGRGTVRQAMRVLSERGLVGMLGCRGDYVKAQTEPGTRT
jgi:DNA-binding GntR family transcriptional regulator